MKRYPLIFLFLLFLLPACSNDKKPTGHSENDIDAARNFIRAALDGKFDEARNVMVDDSDNVHYLDNAERIYKGMNQEIINSYRGASINVHQVNTINDTTTVVIYSNSFKNDHDTLKVVKQNGQWLVDFKYLYEHDLDTLYNKPVNKDSLK
jgi:hypothetical protein